MLSTLVQWNPLGRIAVVAGVLYSLPWLITLLFLPRESVLAYIAIQFLATVVGTSFFIKIESPWPAGYFGGIVLMFMMAYATA